MKIKHTRRRLEVEDRRREILDAAERLVNKKGMSEFSVEKVARQCGASKPLIYAYFKNTGELLADVLSREYEQFFGNPIKFSAYEAKTVYSIDEKWNKLNNGASLKWDMLMRLKISKTTP